MKSRKLEKLTKKVAYHNNLAEAFGAISEEIRGLSNSKSWHIPKQDITYRLKRTVEPKLPEIVRTASITAHPEEVFESFFKKIENHPKETLNRSFLEILHAHAETLRDENASRAKNYVLELEKLKDEIAAKSREKEKKRNKKLLSSLSTIKRFLRH